MAQILGKRPSGLSLTVEMDALAPVVFGVSVNGQTLVRQRSKPLTDIGAIPYGGLFDRSLEIDLSWIESFDRKAFTARLDLPVSDLTRLDEAGENAILTLVIGPNGALRAHTLHPELARHLRDGGSDPVPAEFDRPVDLLTLCATTVGPDVPIYAELAGWLDDGAMAQAQTLRDGAIARRQTPDGQGPCDG